MASEGLFHPKDSATQAQNLWGKHTGRPVDDVFPKRKIFYIERQF